MNSLAVKRGPFTGSHAMIERQLATARRSLYPRLVRETIVREVPAPRPTRLPEVERIEEDAERWDGLS